MKLLLDTCALLWLTGDRKRLSDGGMFVVTSDRMILDCPGLSTIW